MAIAHFARIFRRIQFALPKFFRARISTTVKDDKLEYFENMTDDWWNPNGRYRFLHQFTPFRLSFVIDELRAKGVIKPGSTPLDGLNVLDVGCGVGLISERLAALGATVTGIDPSAKVIQVAKGHTPRSMAFQLQYFVSTAEEHVMQHHHQYDVIVVFLILEHINHPQQFLHDCIKMLKPNGSLFIHMGDQSWRGLLWILLWHVHVTKVVPKNVVTYSQVIPTQVIVNALKNSGCRLVKLQGININFNGCEYFLTKSVKYFNLIHAIKA